MALSKATLIDLNSNELILDLDADTSITADTDDTIHIKIAGSDELTLTATAIAPSTSDGQALGTSSLMFSDLFLASGSVLNFNNGDVTLTHASNNLILDGGSLDLDGESLILDADGDTKIAESSDDVIHLTFAGSTSTPTEFGAGYINLKNQGTQSYIRYYCESSNAHYTQLQAAAHSDYSGNATVTLPVATSTLATTALSETLTNKTLTSPNIGTSIELLTRAEARFQDASGGQFVALEAPATVSSSFVLTLPAADGSSGQFLKTDGSGALSFDTVSSAADDLTAGDAAVTLTTTSGDITIDAQGNDTDIIFKGTDGSADTTFLTLDGSAAGAASFNGAITANAGVVVDNITIDGTEIDLSSGDLTLDVAGDIILDADGADVKIKDGGTDIVSITNNSTDVDVTVATQDKDINFKGDDGGSGITALSLDMSDAGTAVFNHDIRIADDGQIGSASDADAITIAANGVTTFSQAPVLSGASISAGTVPATALDIDGATDIGAAIVDADLFLIDDGAGGTNRKTVASRLKTYIGSPGLIPLAQLASSSDVATIALDGFMDASSYAYYKVFAAVKSAGNGNVLECRFRDGGSALGASAYYYSNHAFTGDIGEATAAASPQNSASLYSDGSTHTAIFEFTIFPDDGISNQSLSRCFWTSSDSKYNSNTRKSRIINGAFHFINDTVPDGFHIHNDTSNFEDYAMYAYGVKKYS